MATKTITLELDACEMLREAKMPGESFSAVVKRLCPRIARGASGIELLAWFSADRSGASPEYPDSLEESLQHDPPPDDPWR